METSGLTEAPWISRAAAGVVAFLAVATFGCGGQAMEILSYTSPIRPGEEGVITVRAAVLSNCSIAFEYQGVPGTPAALPPAETDGTGFVSWRWRFDAGTAPQEVTAAATCTRDGETKQDEKSITIAPG